MNVLYCRYRHDNALRRHFQKQHFLCDQGDCRHREPDYAAYRDAISLRAHQLAAHVEKGSLSQAQLKQMARVDLSVGFFDHRLPQGGQQGGRERQGRREDEYKGKVDGPDYAHDEGDDEEEQYPSLPSAVEQRARQANSNIATKAEKKDNTASSSSASASGSTSMQRSYSQPYGLTGRRFDGNDFPSLSSGTPSPSSSALPAVAPAAFTGRPVVPPNPSDFPTLKQTVKSDKKLRALKDKEKERPTIAPTPVHPNLAVPYSAAMHAPVAPPRSASASPIPTSMPSPSPSAVSDTRIMSHVPLPLPSPVPAGDVPARNKQLITEIKSSLSADEFDSFRIQSSAYRMGDFSASSYLQFFYGLMRGHENEARVEQLLMELIALLPDEAKRKELHGEYAKHKVWEKIATTMKGGKAGAKVEVVAKAGGGGGGSGVETFQGVPARELRRPVVDDKREREERERIDREEKAKELERKREERKRAEEQAKTDKQEKLRLLREERLKEEADKEKKERERSERAEKADKARQEEEDKAAAEESRREKEQKDNDEADSTRQHQLLNGRADKQSNNRYSTATPSRSGTMWTSASPSAVNDEDNFEPAFPSATTTLGSYSSTSSLTDPASTDTYLGNINRLSTVLPHTMLGSLHFLSNLLLTVTAVLSARHPPSLLSPSLRRFHPSDDTRKRLISLSSRLRLSSALEFGRLTQLGVLPQSIYTLSQCVSLWRRQGGGDDGGGEEVRGVCEGMTSGELVVLYEWLHAVLAKVTDEQSEDVQAAIERQQRKSEKEQEVVVDGERRLVPLKKDEEDAAEERKGGGAGAGGGKKKKSKQLLFYGGSGLSGVS